MLFIIADSALTHGAAGPLWQALRGACLAWIGILFIFEPLALVGLALNSRHRRVLDARELGAAVGVGCSVVATLGAALWLACFHGGVFFLLETFVLIPFSNAALMRGDRAGRVAFLGMVALVAFYPIARMLLMWPLEMLKGLTLLTVVPGLLGILALERWRRTW